VQFLIGFVFCLCQWPYEAAALAFEAIPRTLAQNCGLNVIRIMTQLQGKVINPKIHYVLWTCPCIEVVPVNVFYQKHHKLGI
jgi:chaperonin GroEL (HSP60 family)